MLLGSEMLEVAIGLSFFYLLLSIVCSTVTEWIAWAKNLRAKSLEDGITNLVIGTAAQPNGSVDADSDAAFLAELIAHPLIASIKKKDGTLPSYMHARTFAGAIIATVSAGSTTLAGLRAAVEPPAAGGPPVMPEHLREQLAAIVAESGNDVDAFRKGVETWFDDAMERVGGWYKRIAQRWTIVVAILVDAKRPETRAKRVATFIAMLNDRKMFHP